MYTYSNQIAEEIFFQGNQGKEASDLIMRTRAAPFIRSNKSTVIAVMKQLMENESAVQRFKLRFMQLHQFQIVYRFCWFQRLFAYWIILARQF